MLKAKVKEIMKRHNICSKEEAEEAMYFIEDLLQLSIDDTKENEPYATVSIAGMEEARRRVVDLRDLLEDM